MNAMITRITSDHSEYLFLFGLPLACVNRPYRQVVEFSPCETYVMTCNFEEGDKAIIIWEVLTGQMLRAFPMATTTAAGGSKVAYGKHSWTTLMQS